jgi:hypothetical protein
MDFSKIDRYVDHEVAMKSYEIQINICWRCLFEMIKIEDQIRTIKRKEVDELILNFPII